MAEIPLDLLVDMAKAAKQEGKLEVTDEGDGNVRVKCQFTVEGGELIV